METVEIKGVKYLKVFANKKGEVKCPFCNDLHTHGAGGGNGHRVAHCTKPIIINPVFFDGDWYKNGDGYYVEFTNK